MSASILAVNQRVRRLQRGDRARWPGRGAVALHRNWRLRSSALCPAASSRQELSSLPRVPVSQGWGANESGRGRSRPRPGGAGCLRIRGGWNRRPGPPTLPRSSQRRPHLVKMYGRGPDQVFSARHDFFGVAEAVDSGSVDPVHAQFKGAVDRGDRVVVVLCSPRELPARAADGPGSIADAE